jgi:hypothetical protein
LADIKHAAQIIVRKLKVWSRPPRTLGEELDGAVLRGVLQSQRSGMQIIPKLRRTFAGVSLSRGILSLSKAILSLSIRILSLSKAILSLSIRILSLSIRILSLSKAILSLSKAILSLSKAILSLSKDGRSPGDILARIVHPTHQEAVFAPHV